MRYEVMEQLIGLSRVLEARRKRQGTIFLTINFNHIVMVRIWPLPGCTHGPVFARMSHCRSQ